MAETTATPETTPAQTATETQAQEAPKYTDKQLNDLIAKNKGKGVEELLKTAGFQTQDELTKALADYKAMQDKNKTDALYGQTNVLWQVLLLHLCVLNVL